jgi:hypothetical protein
VTVQITHWIHRGLTSQQGQHGSKFFREEQIRPSVRAELAQRLMQNGHDSERPVCLYRGGQHIGRTTLAGAANNEHNIRSEN